VNLPDLNFQKAPFRFRKNSKEVLQIFDVIRKKFIDLTPEEWVRQHIIHFLINEKQTPISMIAVEKQLILNNTKKRTDLVIYNSNLKPLLIVECKAPNIPINQETINQAFRYNLELKVPSILLSNGLKHIFIKINNESAEILQEIPNYTNLNQIITN
jgi:type I site-specific restriction endonuclease